jgi:hypothetical protein
MVQEFDLPMEIIDRKVRSAQDSSSTAPYSSRCLHNLQYKNGCPVVSHMRWWFFCLMPALTQVACVCAFRQQPSLAQLGGWQHSRRRFNPATLEALFDCCCAVLLTNVLL